MRIGDATFYEWKVNYAGQGVSGTRKLRRLEEENGGWRRIVTRQARGPKVVNYDWGKNGGGDQLKAGETCYRTSLWQ